MVNYEAIKESQSRHFQPMTETTTTHPFTDETPLDNLSPLERERILEDVAAVAQARLRQNRENPPLWLRDIHPASPPTDTSNGLDRLLGTWPGDESDETIEQALDQLS